MVPVDQSINFVRPRVAQNVDTILILTEAVYKQGFAEQVLPSLKAMARTSYADEPDTLLCGVWKDPEVNEKVFFLHAFESVDRITKAHVPSKTMENLMSHGREFITATNAHILKVVGGFIYKDTA